MNIWQGRKDSNPRMPESKSGALTNLATPLRRLFETEQRSKTGCLRKIRHFFSVQPTGAVSISQRSGASAKTAEPEPLMRAVKPWRSSQTMASPIDGHRRVATGCRSLWVPFIRAAGESSFATGHALGLTEGVWRHKSGAVKMSRVDAPTGGLSTTTPVSCTGKGEIRSPMPSTQALRPCTKNGTSAPKDKPISAKVVRDKCRPHRWLSASKQVAASDEPPPKPASAGRCLCSTMLAPRRQPVACCKARAACTHRSSVGNAKPAWVSWRSI